MHPNRAAEAADAEVGYVLVFPFGFLLYHSREGTNKQGFPVPTAIIYAIFYSCTRYPHTTPSFWLTLTFQIKIWA